MVRFALAAKFNIPLYFPSAPTMWSITAAQRILLTSQVYDENKRDDERRVGTTKGKKKPVASKHKVYRMAELEAISNATD